MTKTETIVFRTYNPEETKWLFNRLKKLKGKTIKIDGFGLQGLHPRNQTNIYITVEVQPSEGQAT